MPNLDLQIHSTYSDGVDTPQALAEMAKQNGLALVSLTDHDNIHGQTEFLQACAQAGIAAISGVEISAVFHDKTVHILGYNIDLRNSELNKYLDDLLAARKNGYLKLIPELNAQLNAQISIEDAEKSMGEYWGRPNFADYLVRQGIFADKRAAIDYLLTKKGLVGQLPVEKAIELIHNAGGQVVFSHPFAVGVSLSDIAKRMGLEGDAARAEEEKLLVELKNLGLDGIEAIQSGHSNEDIQRALALAEKYNLGITAGTDWHGGLEKIDHQILRVMPNYAKHIGDLAVTDEQFERIKKFLIRT